MTQAILIVDDEFGLADLISEMLAEEGYAVTIAINGRLGLEAARKRRPDLVILDLMMPIMDGREILRQLKAGPALRHIPVVMTTAAPMARDQTGPSLYEAVLGKLFTPEQLFQAVRTALG